MDYMTLSQQRYSVRKYQDRPVEDEKLAKVLEAGRIAPTAANKQPQKIYVLKSPEAMEKARNFTRMMYNAPISDKRQKTLNCQKKFGQNRTHAMEHMVTVG